MRAHELRKGGLKLKIPHQSFQILAMLLERPGEVVSREDLRRKLWPGDVFVNFEASLNSAVQRLRSALQDTSLEPRYIETLPKMGYRFVACIESLIPTSDEAPQGAATLDSAEPPLSDTIPDVLLTASPVQGRRWPYWGAAVILLALLGTYVGHRYRRSRHVLVAQAPSSLAVPSGLTRRSVAVMGFTNASGNAQNLWLSTAFTEMLATELGAGNHLRTVAQEDVARAKLELSLSNEDSYSAHTLTKIHNDLGCDYVVTGSYLAIGQETNGRVRLDARLQDAVTGDTVASFAVVGSRSDLFDLASRAGEQLRAKLGAGTLTSTESEEAKAALPSSPEAARLYSDGLDKLRLYDNVVARDLLGRVVRLQPEYSPAYSALATAWRALGYDAEATSAARKAMDLSSSIPQQARLQTEARFHEMNEDWTRAVEIYSHLQRSYPDNLEYGLDLASAQLNMGNSPEAAATIAALRKLPPPERDDPGIDLAEGKIASELGDYERVRRLAESAAGKSEKAGARLLLARAKLLEGWSLDNLGNFSGAMDAYALAQRVFAESGNFRESATALMDAGSVLAKQGDLAGATRRVEEALNLFRRTGAQASRASALSNLGEIYQSQGNLPRAETFLRESLIIFNNLKLKSKREILTYNLADLLVQQGKFREAKDMVEPLAEHLNSEANKSLRAATMETLGSIAEAQGEILTAVPMYREAALLFKDTGDKTEYADAERSLGRAFLREGDFVSAQQALSEALSVDRDIGAKPDIALSQVGLAELSLARAGPVDMAMLRSAIDELRLRKLTDEEIEADIILARGLIQGGQTAEASNTLRQTIVLSARSYNPIVRFDVALASAQLRIVERRFDDARRTIRPAVLKAVAMGCVRCQLEARLELGEMEMQAGNPERGRAQLHDLADEAGNRGFHLIAEHATADSR